ncbi:MAG: NADH dehydrogenase [delta proteobacterium ML8_D]|jgi:NADH-quinone oxidoreductase E subunit|nr:MAG: NADH dehydrogenase [delta proteobacterium ML8_D]
MSVRVSDLPEYKLRAEEIKKIDVIIQKYKRQRGALIPILQKIQEYIGFIPVEAQKKVAKVLQIPEKDVYGVVTFYSFFTMIPRGRINIRVCMGTACFVRGGKDILDRLVKELGIEPGQTTPDRNFSLQVNRCLGACGLAPVIVVNDKFYQKVKPEKVMDIINSYKL